jgi:hypothetical protein
MAPNDHLVVFYIYLLGQILQGLVGDVVLDLFWLQPAIPEPLAPQLAAIPLNQNKMLLNPAHNLGPDMPFSQFCESFGLQGTYCRK